MFATICSPTLLLLASFAGQDDLGWTGVLDEASFAALHELREDEAPALRGEDVELGDGRAYLTRPVGEPVGSIVVIHEWWGLNDHVRHWADRLAADGYVALAVDLYGGTVATTREEALAAMRAVDEDAALATLGEARRYLAENGDVDGDRMACIGWCFGGGWSLKMAIDEPALDAAVVYYGRLVTDVDVLASIEAKVLGIFGKRDSGIPPESVAAFRDAASKAGIDLTVVSYDADHAFANPSSGRYDAEHAAEAWQRTRAFLCRSLWPEPPAGMLSDGSRALEVWAPDGWVDQGASGMRLSSFGVAESAECYVVALPGDGGGVAANLNRWRSQMGADELDSDELDALPRVPMLGDLAPMMRVEGSFRGMGREIDDAVLIGAIAELDGETVFVKMIGPRPEVEDAQAAFGPFCRSLR